MMFENRVCFSVRGEFGAEMKFDSETEIPREELERSIDKNVLLEMMCLDQLGYKKATAIDVTIKGADLATASSGDGTKIIKVFVKNAAGTWSVA